MTVTSDHLITRRSYTTISGKFKPTLINLGPWRKWAFASVLIMAVLLTVIPTIATLAASFMTRFGYFYLPQVWTLEHWRFAFAN